jgi:proteic killer suppression protein
MIKSFRHKGLERFFRKSDPSGIQAQHAGRIDRVLTLLDEVSSTGQLNIPGMFLHPLKGERKGEWAMTVSGNWRITFRFEGEDVIVVNLEDYH